MQNKLLFETYLYKKFLGLLLKNGCKSKAKKILDKAFLILLKITKKSFSYLLALIFIKLNVFVEAREIKIRQNKYFVPFPLTLKRRYYLIIKWILKAILLNKQKQSMVKKIVSEFLLIYRNLSSKTFEYKKINNTNAYLNRSNMHYRW